MPLSTSSIPSSFEYGIRYLPIDGQREPGPPLVKKDGVVGGEVGSLGSWGRGRGKVGDLL